MCFSSTRYSSKLKQSSRKLKKFRLESGHQFNRKLIAIGSEISFKDSQRLKQSSKNLKKILVRSPEIDLTGSLSQVNRKSVFPVQDDCKVKVKFEKIDEKF